MTLVKKTIELDQEAITRIKTALNAKSAKDFRVIQSVIDFDFEGLS